MISITEQPSRHRHLEKMTVEEITAAINKEGQTVSLAIEKALPSLNALIHTVVDKIKNGGRFFYLGAGSGGRLSVLDVIEVPTTYGVNKGVFNVVLAGGVERLIEALEEKEDDTEEGWMQLQDHDINENDFVLGISASGTTPFVLAALQQCRKHKITTGCIVSNPDSSIAKCSDFPVEVITGPEFVTGSTRMKCGTAQKMIFDIISTTTMIRLGKVEDNSMVNVKLINDKIIDRGVRMLMQKTGLNNYEDAKDILMAEGSVSKAIDTLKTSKLK